VTALACDIVVSSSAMLVVTAARCLVDDAVEAMGLLQAVDPIPNAFRTVTNLTGMPAVAALDDGRRRRAPAAPADPETEFRGR
jgi:Na+/H+-dicarboxylate symporter